MSLRGCIPATAIVACFLATPTLNTAALAQPAAILDAARATATVETVNLAERSILLRGETGNLVTVRVPQEARNLPQVQPGDKVVIDVLSTVGAHIARPGDPLPESTASMARAEPGERPGGLLVEHRRVRVKIEGINTENHSVAVIGPDRVPRTFVLRQPAMQALLPSLRVGDEVDVTFTDAVSLRVVPPGGT